MKKAQFKDKYGYRDQAPRCYLCAHYRAADVQGNRHSCHVEKGVVIKVKPNGICREYKPGAYDKAGEV